MTFRSSTLRRNPALFALLLPAFVLAQSAIAQAALTGQWQGTTEDAKPSRVVLMIEKADAGVVYLLDGDNSAWPHATTAFTLHGTDLAFRIANVEASYDGKLSADNTSFTGTWKQHGASVPLKLTHVTGDAAWEIPSSGKPMPVNADPAFEIATIKPADPTDNGSGFQLMGDRLRARNETLESIVAFAYGIHPRQILNAPGWFGSEHWQIDGLADTPGEPNLKQMRAMYRKLLAERFVLKLEPQKQEISIYSIEVGKDGPKLTRSRVDEALPDSTGNWNNGVRDIRYTNITMDEFATDLGFTEDRPVVNHTGLSGRYDFRLRWSTGEVPVSENSSSDTPPALFTAMQEQLGLKVQATRANTDVYAIAHVERPSPN